MRTNRNSVQVLDDTDAMLAKMRWQEFQHENEQVLWGGSEKDWHPGKMRKDGYPQRLPFAVEFDDEFYSWKGPVGNTVRNLIDVFDDGDSYPWLRCLDCSVSWRGPEACFFCGKPSIGLFLYDSFSDTWSGESHDYVQLYANSKDEGSFIEWAEVEENLTALGVGAVPVDPSDYDYDVETNTYYFNQERYAARTVPIVAERNRVSMVRAAEIRRAAMRLRVDPGEPASGPVTHWLENELQLELTENQDSVLRYIFNDAMHGSQAERLLEARAEQLSGAAWDGLTTVDPHPSTAADAAVAIYRRRDVATQTPFNELVAYSHSDVEATRELHYRMVNDDAGAYLSDDMRLWINANSGLPFSVEETTTEEDGEEDEGE